MHPNEICPGHNCYILVTELITDLEITQRDLAVDITVEVETVDQSLCGSTLGDVPPPEALIVCK